MNEPYIDFDHNTCSKAIFRNRGMVREKIYESNNLMLLESMLEEIHKRDKISLVYEDWYESSFN